MDYRPIIESKYNRQKWQELLHDIFSNRAEFWQTPYEISINNNLARQALWLGTITLTDGETIAVYEIELSESVDIERNRRGIRDMLLSEWRNRDAGAFMFCYRRNESVLRFSYVSEAWTFADDGSYQKESTDTKRFTYLLGEGHRSRTAIEQFGKLKSSSLRLKDLTKAFSVDAVSDMFFDGYKKQYEDIIQYITGKRMVKVANKWEERKMHEPCENIMQEFAHFPNPEKAIRDYVKKLMGRLVFLQFLQKKGWLGVPADADWGSGDHEFIQNLFAHSLDKDHFIDNELESLFEDLNSEDKKKLRNYRTPYLNGGLFERDATDEAAFPLPAKYMESLLNFYASYNFTIDENDPDDAEVGVDPEMLGRIFENLLEDNKDKGAFYTPKEIVSYMCRESLIAYLQTDIEDEATKEAIRLFVTTHDAEALGANIKFRHQIDDALKNVKICDPAIGSGAFPMGLLKELFLCRTALEGITQNKAAEIKKHIIQQNIYGVDIERGAVDIARLRFWLSLIVDEETPQALPNLDFKIMQGNSLLEQYKGVDLSKLLPEKIVDKEVGVQATFFDEEFGLEQIELQDLLNKYYSCTQHEQKIELKKKISDTIQQQVHNRGIRVDFGNLDLSGNNQFFLWHTWFYDVFSKGGFDIVIGNPPYVKEYTKRAAFDGFRETSPYYIGKMDLWYGFACHGLDMLKYDGVLCFIAQNNWTTSAGAKLMRKKVINDTQIVQMLDFYTYMVFDDADIQTMIMLFKRDNTTDNYPINYRCLTEGAKKEDMLLLMEQKAGKTKYLTPIIKRQYYNNKLLTFSDNNSILNKISYGKSFLTENEATNGIHTHHDCVSNKIHQLFPDLEVGRGIFVISDTEKQFLNLSLDELSLIKPFYSSTEIMRYWTNRNNHQWIIYTTSKFKNDNSLDNYPNIKKHLDAVKKAITSDNKPYGLHRAREERFFRGEKIVSLRKCVGRPCFSYNDFDCYVPAMYYIIKTTRWDLKFLTGILNSKVISFWLRNKGKMQGENYQIDKEPLMSIPIPIVDETEQKSITDIIKQIIKIKTDNPSADTSALESEIDRLVYQLYGLTEEEIKIIEGNE